MLHNRVITLACLSPSRARHLRLWLPAACLFCVTSSLLLPAFAAPASSGSHEARQPDGSVISLRKRGDEWFHWRETAEGFAVAQSEDGYWRYARPSETEARFEAIDGAVVGQVSPRSIGLLPGATVKRELLDERIRAYHIDRPVEVTSVLSETEGTVALASEATEPKLPMKLGKRSCAVILAAFNDHWQGNSVSSQRGRPKSEYVDLLGELGHSSSGSHGSVRDYYLENSYGRLDMEFVVSDWVQLPHDESWYGNNDNEVEGEQRVKTLIQDAIEAADAKGFDFSLADSDDDTWVDLLLVIHSGHSESHNSNPDDSIWPRKWALKQPMSRDEVSMYLFATSSAMRGRVSSTSIAGIGTIAHEIGHLFGLPDLYDRGDTTKGIGTWGLMGYGSWGAASGTDDTTRPVHMTAYSKYRLGVLDPEIVSSRDALELPPIEEHPVAHMIRDGLEDTNEYFLLEYRKRTGLDADLPGDGILIWHVDDTQPDYNSSSFEHPTLRLEEAWGSDDLASERFGTSSQMWRADNGIAGGFSDLSGNQYTNARRYADNDFYIRFPDSASRTHIAVDNFSSPDAVDSQRFGTKVMTYDLTTLRPTLGEVDASTGNFTLSWKSPAAAENFEVQRSRLGTVDSLFDGAEDGQRSHALWSFSGAARRSSGGAASGEYSYMLSAMDETQTRYLSEVQSMTLRQPFRLTEQSVISYDVVSHLSLNKGYLSLLLSKDDGETWTTLLDVAGYFDPFDSLSLGPSQWKAAGFEAGDLCRLRFWADIKQIWGWIGYPNYGFAIDNFSLENVEIDGPEAWSRVSQGPAATELEAFVREPGDFAFRARAFVNGQWQGFSEPFAISADTAGESLYSRWIKTKGLDPSDFHERSDTDADGLPNFWEFALDLDPQAPDRPETVDFALDRSEGQIVATAKRGRGDVGYELQYSDDLENWSAAQESETSDEEFARFSVDAAMSARFVRLRVFMLY